MQHEWTPELINRARGTLPDGLPAAHVAQLLHQARDRARARGLPPTYRVVLKMLADLHVDAQGHPHTRG